MSNSQWNSDQAVGERALREIRDRDEADRKLGAAVRDCFNGVTPKKAARIAITIASECEDGSFSEMVFSAIAKALKEEGQR